MPLSEYRRKRRSGRSPEPRGRCATRRRADNEPRFVIQHHAARRTEDHPLEYAAFQGVIPEGEYGAGGVIVWDHGSYANRSEHEMAEGLEHGHLSFQLHGEKLRGGYALTRIREGKDETWLLVKRKDADADARRKPVKSQLGVPPACGGESALSGRTLEDLDELP
jgi:hypothetical protein